MTLWPHNSLLSGWLVLVLFGLNTQATPPFTRCLVAASSPLRRIPNNIGNKCWGVGRKRERHHKSYTREKGGMREVNGGAREEVVFGIPI